MMENYHITYRLLVYSIVALLVLLNINYNISWTSNTNRIATSIIGVMPLKLLNKDSQGHSYVNVSSTKYSNKTPDKSNVRPSEIDVNEELIRGNFNKDNYEVKKAYGTKKKENDIDRISAEQDKSRIRIEESAIGQVENYDEEPETTRKVLTACKSVGVASKPVSRKQYRSCMNKLTEFFMDGGSEETLPIRQDIVSSNLIFYWKYVLRKIHYR